MSAEKKKRCHGWWDDTGALCSKTCWLVFPDPSFMPLPFSVFLWFCIGETQDLSNKGWPSRSLLNDSWWREQNYYFPLLSVCIPWPSTNGWKHYQTVWPTLELPFACIVSILRRVGQWEYFPMIWLTYNRNLYLTESVFLLHAMFWFNKVLEFPFYLLGVWPASPCLFAFLNTAIHPDRCKVTPKRIFWPICCQCSNHQWQCQALRNANCHQGRVYIMALDIWLGFLSWCR